MTEKHHQPDPKQRVVYAVGAYVPHMRQIVDERNQVVHHFAEYFNDALSRGAYDEVLHDLRGRHERALQ